MIEVVEARYVHGYTLWLSFNDGAEGNVDLASELYGSRFEPLRDLVEFRYFKVNRELGSIVWENGAMLEPDFLYSRLKRIAAN
jgi:hypothetical protein